MANKKASSNAKRTSSASTKSTKVIKSSPVASGSSETKTRVTTVKAIETPERTRRRISVPTMSVFNRGSLLPALVAEFVGTFLLASVIVTQQNQPIALLFALIGIVLVIGGISGAHINPAVTIAAWVSKKVNAMRALGYIGAQVLGAMLALVVLTAFVNQASDVGDQAAALGQAAPELFKSAPVPSGKEMALFFAELLGAAILGLAYASALRAGRDKLSAALTVGGGVFVALIIGGTAGTYVAGSVLLNPAAAISVQALNFVTVWPVAIYIVASVIGAVVGFALYNVIAANVSEEAQE